MSLILRAWLMSLALVLAAVVVTGLFLGAVDPATWIQYLIAGLSVVPAVLLVGLWYRRSGPAAGIARHLVATLTIPALYWIVGVAIVQGRADDVSTSVAKSVLLQIAVALGLAVVTWRVSVRRP